MATIQFQAIMFQYTQTLHRQVPQEQFNFDLSDYSRFVLLQIFNAARSCFASYDERKSIVRELKNIYGDH